MKLLGCPFCGDTPQFTSLKWSDNNDYASLNLECCVTMEEAVWWSFMLKLGLNDETVTEKMKETLTKRWNERVGNGTE